jgi:hypothetical protein
MEPRAMSRMSVLKATGGALMAATVLPAFGEMKMQDPDRWPQVPDFPQPHPELDPKLVKKFVIAAHGNLEVVKEMLEAYPGLLNATWDWGNGDFERAIEGAGHMGNREIAEYLISRGARMNMFCAAMLGDLGYVKAALASHPHLKDSLGPHGIPLLAHAKAGKDQAKPVLDYLESLA